MALDASLDVFFIDLACDAALARRAGSEEGRARSVPPMSLLAFPCSIRSHDAMGFYTLQFADSKKCLFMAPIRVAGFDMRFDRMAVFIENLRDPYITRRPLSPLPDSRQMAAGSVAGCFKH
jgi:hypothetical protein